MAENRKCYNAACKFCVELSICSIDKKNCEDADMSRETYKQSLKSLGFVVERNDELVLDWEEGYDY